MTCTLTCVSLKLHWHRHNGVREALKKINIGYNEFGTKGGRVSDLNHYFKQLWNSEKGGGG